MRFKERIGLKLLHAELRRMTCTSYKIVPLNEDHEKNCPTLNDDVFVKFKITSIIGK